MKGITANSLEYPHSRLTYDIIGAAMEVHNAIGPGMLESTYSRCLEYELTRRGMAIEREKPISISYKTLRIENAFRADFVVEGKVLLEVKAVESIVPVHAMQTLTNLRLAGLQIGLIINFHDANLRKGIKRLIV